MKVNVQYVSACVLVAAHARMFVETTDKDPIWLHGNRQPGLWDGLTGAVALLEKLEAEQRAPRSGASVTPDEEAA